MQVIYNIFEQEPADELLPAALEHNVGILVRVVFDEGILTSKYTVNSEFPEGDFRKNDFAGDRLARAVKRVEQIETDIAESGLTQPQAALRFALAHTAVRTIIAGIRSVQQTEANGAASDLPPLTPELLSELHERAWLRGFWYSGKYYLCQVMVWLIDA